MKNKSKKINSRNTFHYSAFLYEKLFVDLIISYKKHTFQYGLGRKRKVCVV